MKIEFLLTFSFLLFLLSVLCWLSAAVSAKGCGSWQERSPQKSGQRHERVEAGIGHRRPQDPHRGTLPTTGHQSRNGKNCLLLYPKFLFFFLLLFPYLSKGILATQTRYLFFFLVICPPPRHFHLFLSPHEWCSGCASFARLASLSSLLSASPCCSPILVFFFFYIFIFGSMWSPFWRDRSSSSSSSKGVSKKKKKIGTYPLALCVRACVRACVCVLVAMSTPVWQGPALQLLFSYLCVYFHSILLRRHTYTHVMSSYYY